MAVKRDIVLATAEKLLARGKYDAALKEYGRLLDDNPNDVNTLNRIGDLWVRINRNDEAVKVFARIADHYARDGFFLKAIAIYKKINKLDPSKLEIYAKLADLYAKQGLAMEAKSQYQVLADYYLKHGDTANALQIYRKISELDPTAINVHVKLADLYSQNNQTAEALKEYDRVGRLLLKRGMLDEAVQVFRKAVKIDSSNVELIESLVNALTEAKDFNNAAQLIEAALETNQNNARLLAMLGRALVGRGDLDRAKATLDRAHAADPSDLSVREALGEIALRRGDADTALSMVTPVVEKALGRGDRNAAVETLNKILRTDAGHAPTLERLVAVYTRLSEETNILAAMNSLAEAHISRGRHDEAAGVLEKLIAREPQNQQHRTKLQFVKSQTGGSDTLPIRNKPAEIPPMEVEEPPPSFDMSEEPSLSLDLDASEAIDVDFGLDASPAIDFEPAPEPAPAPAPAPPPVAPKAAAPAPKPAPAPAPVEPEADDLDFITEHITEAEVFAKYGLAEKAMEHLRAVIERSPRNTTALDRLFRIQLDEGDVNGGRTTATHLVAVLEDAGDASAADAVISEFTARGHQFEVARAPRAAATPAPTPEIEFDAPQEISFELETESSDFSLDSSSDTAAEIELETEIPTADFGELPEIETELPDFTTEMGGATFGESAGSGISFDDTPSEMSLDHDTGISFEEPVGATAAADDLFGGLGDTAASGDEPPIDELSEIDFYVAQELYDEARVKVDALLERYPSSVALTSRAQQIAAASSAMQAAAAPAAKPAPAAPPPAAPAARPPALSRDEIESELLSAIPDDEDDVIPPPVAAAPAPAPAAVPAHEENLFADEDDFFDLASELEEELAEDEPLSLSEEEQSLEEIFKEFKKGVEQQLDSEDYDTHYNLGIAYKEMGLIDEAIGEFQLASKDPKRAVECSSMLGLCFLEKGMPQLAIKWYRKGLEMPEISEEEHVGLLYDLGAAHQELGDTEAAQKAFMEVYGMNTNYRDVVMRIKQLEDARK